VRSKGFKSAAQLFPKKIEEAKQEIEDSVPCQHCGKELPQERLRSHEKTCMKSGPGSARPKTPTKTKPVRLQSELLRPSSSQPVLELVACPYCKLRFSSLSAEAHIQSCSGSLKPSEKAPPSRASLLTPKVVFTNADEDLDGAVALFASRLARLLQAPKERRFCPHCGEKYVANAKFCAFCGAAK
jgi:hypothetical protein